ncbi:hypothetical protein MSG37_17460 [Shewanella sp. 1CM18E]|uniref:hypothetical protein n=1 Tax=Shewanella sp. 1CM18E TaxID=2929169 RepID=UPI0020C10FA6|nr:hypothetical protein [Shewanella sp. 1CM18E]MCK8046679.1 hypothetical protein [Shewanella sp. 1CM18E]
MKISQREFAEQLPLIDKALSCLAVIMCVAGLVFVIKTSASELSIMTMIASVVIASSIYLFKVLVLGVSQHLVLIADSIPAKPITQSVVKPTEQKKVANFGLCTFCNQYETKNTLSGRYVCSDCYKVFLKVRGQVLEPKLDRFMGIKRVS